MTPETLETLRRDYERTGNPLIVWHVYRRCRIERAPLPEWVLRYLDEAADQLLEPRNAEGFIQALGFRQHGRRTPWAQSEKLWRDFRLAALAQEQMEGGGTQEDAWSAVADTEGCSIETVRNAWRDFRNRVSTTR